MSRGLAGEIRGYVMGRFELVIGEAKNGFPVYKKVHSREMPSEHKFLMYR